MKKTILKLIILITAIALFAGAIALAAGEPPVISTQTPSGTQGTSSTVTTGTNPSEIFLHVGSPLILADGKLSPLDPNNLEVAATIVSDRTLVPLRAISEYFRAAVDYDSVNRTAVIDYNGKRFLFPIDQNKYIITDGQSQKEVTLDTKTTILNDRTMVPLRAICEDILGLKVSYYDKLIAIGNKSIDLQEEKTLAADVKGKIGAAVKVQTMDELSASINLAYNGGIRTALNSTTAFDVAKDSSAPTASAESAEKSSAGSAQSSTDYSATNTQVEGIDEADIVKTDGSYIYIAGNNAVRIVSADNGKLNASGVITMPQNKYIREIYIDGTKLVILGHRNEQTNMPNEPVTTPKEPSVSPVPAPDSRTAPDAKVAPDTSTATNTKPTISIAADAKMILPYYSKTFSFVDIYDISDKKNPVFLKGHEMEGNYQTSRKNGEIVYLITNTYVYNGIVVPMMRDTGKDTEAVPVPLKDIMVMPQYPSSGYITVSALNITNNDKTEVEAIAASGHVTYMNSSSLYLAAHNGTGTSITRFSIDGMNIGYAGSGTVKGYVLNQFSMDEYEGNLRIATSGDNENNLFVLDTSLNVIGSVTGLAKGERIYSVRFMGDKGYVVTFRNIDPLFVFDLSDPKAPRVTGELKIPGFSNYLHPVGKDLLLGIGLDTYEIYKKDAAGNDVIIGTRQGGIKLSLFDVSDMGKPKEISKYILGDSGSYTDVLYDHKAVMFDNTRQNLAFDATFTTDQLSGKYKHGAVIFNYSNNTISLKGVADYVQPDYSETRMSFYGRRVLYIGNILYYVQDGVLASYNYDTLARIASLSLR